MTHTVSPLGFTERSHDCIKCATASMLQVDVTLLCKLMFTDWKNEDTFIFTVTWGLVCTHEYSIVSVVVT